MAPEDYLDRLASLNTGSGRKTGHPKPHKPCLLLAVLDLVQSGQIQSNKIYLNDALAERFKAHFQEHRKEGDQLALYTPFYHLKTDGFWRHKVKPGRQADYDKLKESLGTGLLRDAVDYAYLDEMLFKLFQDAMLAPEIRSALVANLQNRRQQFEGYLRSLGKTEKTTSNYATALNGTLAKLLTDGGRPTSSLFDVGSVHEYELCSKSLQALEAFQVKDKKGKGMYGASLKAYGEFLKDSTEYNLQQDLDAIEKDRKLGPTQKRALRNARLGQGKFRSGVITYWQGCAVTGYADVRLLVASHIKPWALAAPEERLSHTNGLLLLPNLDKVFDRQLVSFDERGRIMVSPHLEDPAGLGIREDMMVERLSAEHQRFLAFHREQFQEKRSSG